MRLRLLSASLLVSVVLTVPLVCVSAPASAAVQASENIVTVPFAPPLGKELRYRLTRSDTGSGKNDNSFVDLYIRFERSSDQYRMHTRTAFTGMPAEARQLAPIKLMEVPVIFRVDNEGTLVGVEDEQAYWTRLDQMMDSFIAADPEAKAEDRALLAGIVLPAAKLPHFLDESGRRCHLAARRHCPWGGASRLKREVPRP